ncbi:MAG: NADH-quinone oxidoreductase subunit M, partial [Methylococcales bacterium]|nr:NADH-quinone oxidoreductase subunit M [Methylococcales bacterium]
MDTGLSGLMTATVFLPAAGAVFILLLVRGDRNIRVVAAMVAVADLVLTLLVFGPFSRGDDAARFQFIDQFTWIPGETLRANYLLGVDGLSAPLVALTGILGLCAALASWRIDTRVREHFVWLLVLQTAVMGVFSSLDLLLFFLFWELELVPMYMLISIWGTGRKEYSAMKFLMFTILGSAFMLVAIVAVFLTPDVGTFDMRALSTQGTMLGAGVLLPLGALFWLFFIGFAIKLPVWPLHTWLPDAHTNAPTAASVMLAGVLLKMGGYGLLRINVGMFPSQAQQFAWALVTLGVISVLYGAVVTLRQTDLKRLIAYSSVSHMGFVTLGIFCLNQNGIEGGILQMINHGIITGALFLCVGMIYERTHTRMIEDYGGLFKTVPIYIVFFTIFSLAAIGFPGMNAFIGEFLIISGAFKANMVIAAFSIVGVILGASYMVWLYYRIALNEINTNTMAQLT